MSAKSLDPTYSVSGPDGGVVVLQERLKHPATFTVRAASTHDPVHHGVIRYVQNRLKLIELVLVHVLKCRLGKRAYV